MLGSYDRRLSRRYCGLLFIGVILATFRPSVPAAENQQGDAQASKVRQPQSPAVPLLSDFRIDSVQRRPLADDWILDFNATYSRGQMPEKRRQIITALRRAQNIRKPQQTEVPIDTDEDGRADTWVYFRGDRPMALERDRFGIGVRDERIDLSVRPVRTKVHQGWFVEPPAGVTLPAVPQLAVTDLFDWASAQKAAPTKSVRNDVAKRLISNLDNGLKTLATKHRDAKTAEQIARFVKRAQALLPQFQKIHRQQNFSTKLRFAGGFRLHLQPFDFDGKDGKEIVAGFDPAGVSRIQFYARDWQEREGFLAEVAFDTGAVDHIRLKTRQLFSVNGFWVSVRPDCRNRIAEKLLLPGWVQYRNDRWYAALPLWRAGTQLAAVIGDFSFNRSGVPIGDLVQADFANPKMTRKKRWSFDVGGMPASALLLVGRDFAWRRSQAIVDAWTDLADRATDTRRFQQALALNDTIFRLGDKLDKPTAKVGALESMAKIYRHLGNYDRAMESLFASLDLESSLGYALSVARRLRHLVNDDSGAERSAVSVQRSVAMRSHAMAMNRGCKLAMIAALYADLGEQKNAESYMQEAGRILKPLANAYTQADLLNLRAGWDLRAGRLDIALKRLESSLRLIEQQIAAQQADERGATLMHRGQSQHTFTIPGTPSYMRVGMRSKTNPRVYLSITTGLIAETFLRRAELETKSDARKVEFLKQARNWQERSLADLKACGERAGILVGELRLAEIAVREGKLDEAKASSQRIAREAKQFPLFEVHWRSLALHAAVLAAQGKRTEAIVAFEKAAAQIESVRAGIHSESVRRGFFGAKRKVYEELAALHYSGRASNRSAADKKVWQCMERAKARALLDIVAGQPLKAKGKAVTSFAKNHPLMFQQLQGRTGVARSPGDLQKAHAKMLARIDDNPGLQEVASLITVKPVTLARIQALLKPEDLLVEFFLTREHVFAAVISPSTIEVKRLPGLRRDSLRTGVEAYRACLQNPSLPYRALAKSLYAKLLAPCLAGRDTVKHVCIVPGGPLHYLPFQALMDPQGRFVAEQRIVSYAPSASALVYAMNRRRKGQQGNAQAKEALIVAAPDPKLDYGALPFALYEGKRIHAMAPKPKRLLSGPAAKETDILRSLENARYFHFAGHTHLPASSPMRAALLCSEDIDADGHLAVRDLFGLNLRGCELAVLSACDTRLGRWSRGDEIVGIERAFLRAGVPSVIASLWKVEDAATSLLMEEFYNNLWQRKLSRGEALRQAQLAVLKDPKKIVARQKRLHDQEMMLATRGNAQFRALKLSAPRKLPAISDSSAGKTPRTHPAFWAAFVLSGDWR